MDINSKKEVPGKFQHCAPNSRGIKPHTIKITGLLNTISYQRAKTYAETFALHLPELYTKPKIRGYLDVQWSDYLLKCR